jgi:3-oxoadipate enol-lactonase
VALAAPERVLTLTLCMTYARAGRRWQEWTRHQIASSVHRTDQELVEELMLLTLSEATYEEMAEQQQMTLMRDLVLSYPHRQRRDGYVRQLQATATHDAYERLPRLAVPVHVIGAEQDLMVPVWKSRELAQLIPGARLSVVAGAAHAVHLERTREFNALVLEFLKAPGKH